MPCNAEDSEKWQTKIQIQPGVTIQETSGSVIMEMVNRWPNCVIYDEYVLYSGADKSLARPGRKQATATEDFEFHIFYL